MEMSPIRPKCSVWEDSIQRLAPIVYVTTKKPSLVISKHTVLAKQARRSQVCLSLPVVFIIEVPLGWV